MGYHEMSCWVKTHAALDTNSLLCPLWICVRQNEFSPIGVFVYPLLRVYLVGGCSHGFGGLCSVVVLILSFDVQVVYATRDCPDKNVRLGC